MRSQKPLWPFVLNASNPQANGLVAWYPLGVPQQTIVDCSVYRRHLTTANSPTWSGGLGGGAAMTTVLASTQYAEGSHQPIKPTTGLPFTLACWIRTPTTTANQAPLALCSSSDDTPYILIRLDSTGVVQCQYRNDGAELVLFGTKAYVADTWHHVAITGSTDTRMRVYVDGVLRDTDLTLVSAGITLNRVSVGRLGRPSATMYYSGRVEDARVYNRALSESDMYQLYDPRTRWSLRYQLNTVAWKIPAASGGATAYPWHHYQMMGAA